MILCEKLWESGYIEESFIACDWSYFIHKQYQPSDFKIFERWVDKFISNWATCDIFCNHCLGAFVELYPRYLRNLKTWAQAKNRWMRRAASVSLIIPARKGLFLETILELAEILIKDNDEMVQKGYGWLLKEASRRHQKKIFNFVVKQKKIMSRTALRYAVEKMPDELRKKAMIK